MDGGVSAVGSIFNASWKIATVVYELKAVGEQTRDLLDTTSQVSSTLQHAHVLRRQRSGLLNVTEKRWIDDVLQASEKAVGNVAALIEPARVDMQTQFNKIKLLTRTQFIFRDSPKVQVQLGRLGIAAQGLNTAMGVLCARDGSVGGSLKSPTDGGTLKKVDSGASENELRPPPSYEVVELLDRRRESVLKRRASKLPLATPANLDAELNKVRPLEEDPNPLPMVNINVAEVQPTPVTSPQPNQYAESDGLQVVDNYWNSNPWQSSTPDHQSRHPSPIIPSYPELSGLSTSPGHYHHHHHHSISTSHSPSIRSMDSNTNYFSHRPPAPPPQNSWQQPPMYSYPPPPSPSTSSLNSHHHHHHHHHNNNRLLPDPPSAQPLYSNTTPQSQPPYISPQQNYHPPRNHNPNDYTPPNPPNPYAAHPPAHLPSISTSTLNEAPSPPSSTPSYCRSPDTLSSSSSPNPTPHPHPHLQSRSQSQSTPHFQPRPPPPPLPHHPYTYPPLPPQQYQHQHQHHQHHQQQRPPSRSSSILTTEELSTLPLPPLPPLTRQMGRARGRAWLEHHSGSGG